MTKPQYLTRYDCHKLDEALATEDLEFIVTTVDGIAERAVQRALHPACLGSEKHAMYG